MNLSHPNAHLSPEDVSDAIWAVSPAFRRCHMEPEQLEFLGCNSFLLGSLWDKKFLVYVQVTNEGDDIKGCSVIPGILVDAAAEYRAEPHLICVHLHRESNGTSFKYFGYEEFIEHVLSHDSEHGACLVSPKKFADYVRILKGRVSKLELNFREEGDALWMTLAIDGVVPYSYVICPGSLLESTWRSDDHEIFTCTCRHAGCNGVHRGVRVVHSGGYTVWKAYYANGKRLFLFDRSEYRDSILKKCGEVIDFARSKPERYCLPFESDQEKAWLERTYYEATEPK